MDFFTVFLFFLWVFFGCCCYLAISFTRAQVKRKNADPESDIVYRADQKLCIVISVVCFWSLVFYSVYTILDMLLK